MDQVIEGLVTIIRGLEPKKRHELFSTLLTDGILTKDDRDIIVIESRRGGPSRPISQAVERIRRKKRKKREKS